MVKHFLFFISFLFIIPTQAKILIATVAQVKSHVITSREIDIHKQMNDALGDPLGKLANDGSSEETIREWLLFLEATSFYNTRVSNKKVQSELAKAKERLGSKSRWRKLGVTDKELKAKVKRRLESGRIFQFKRKASVLPVSLNDLETEYNQNRVSYGNLKFEEVKEKIRKNKTEENLKKRLLQWFSVLEKKYKVQRFSNFESS